MKYYAAPSWILIVALRPLYRDGHPWKHGVPTLANYHAHQTPLARLFDVGIAFCPISLLWLVHVLMQ
jgi:hypothetical protein